MAEQPLWDTVAPLAAAGGAGTAPACYLRSQSPLPWPPRGGVHWKQEPEAKLIYTSGDGETYALKQPVSDWNHTDIAAGMLPTS